MLYATLLFFLQLTPSQSVERLTIKEIPRFQLVATGLYRGGQPERDGFQYLKKNGIKTVINLRMENDEESIVKELGMNYVHIPITIKAWSKIPDKAIESYFKIVNDPANYPIFFHCRRGADRTGAMASFYRIAVQGWHPNKAFQEARDSGMRWWYQAIKQQIHSFKAQARLLPATAEAIQ